MAMNWRPAMVPGLSHSIYASHKTRTVPAAEDLANHVLDPLSADDEPDEVRGHQHEDVEHRACRADVAVPRRAAELPQSKTRQPPHHFRAHARARGHTTHLRGGQQRARGELGEDEAAREPAPREEAEGEVVPERDEREDEHDGARAVARAAERHVDVARDPEVVAPVPRAPEAERRVVVRHAAHHVLRRVDAVRERPEAEEAPRDEELQGGSAGADERGAGVAP